MKHIVITKILIAALCLLGSAAWASTTWYVNGVTGSDNNNCTSPTTACKTIGHAISLASSGDFIIVAAAMYTEKLTISKNLNVTGSGAATTIIDGGASGTVVAISGGAQAILSKLTIRNGRSVRGGGIGNGGTVTINNSTIAGNVAWGGEGRGLASEAAFTTAGN